MKLQTLLQNNLTVRDGVILDRLFTSGSDTPKQLTSEFITAANLSRIIDKLEAFGLVYKENDEHDRRSHIVHLTKQGEEVCNG